MIIEKYKKYNRFLYNFFIMFFLHVFIFAAAFILMWMASELVIDSVNHFAKRLHISSFAASFFILGVLTTIPELSVGINSIIDKQPEIFVGDLIGASFVLFLLAIPFLAIIGNGITLSHQLTNNNLIFSLFVIISPTMFVLDGQLSRKDGLFLMMIYLLLLLFMESKTEVIKNAEADLIEHKKHNTIPMIKLIIGSVTIFLVGKLLVDQTLYFANIFNVHTYLISLLALSIGTNLPEFIIAVNSVIRRDKEVAFGDYIGSAAGNTFVFGLLLLFKGSFTVHNGNFFVTFALFALAMICFYIFSKSDRSISRYEGIVLLSLYFFFLLLEIGF